MARKSLRRNNSANLTSLLCIVIVATFYWKITLMIGVLIILFNISFRVLHALCSHLKNRKLGSKQIDSMNGLQSERYVATLLRGRGYSKVTLTESYDFGVDIIAMKDKLCWGIQVKRYAGLVGADAVRQVVTAQKYYNCDRVMVVTNSRYSGVARKLAESNGCRLIDRDHLMKWNQ